MLFASRTQLTTSVCLPACLSPPPLCSFSPLSAAVYVYVYAVIEFMYILHFAARTSCSGKSCLIGFCPATKLQNNCKVGVAAAAAGAEGRKRARGAVCVAGKVQ